VHLIAQYSDSRPGITRMTVKRASHCGQLDRVAAAGARIGMASRFSGMVVKAVIKDGSFGPIPNAALAEENTRGPDQM
jgi:hypothetical protein